MFPEDRVLVGVINRKRDLDLMRESAWYRIPQARMRHGVHAEYIAFYVSGTAAKAFSSAGVHFYARKSGVELAYRRDLLPQEPHHPRADHIYYKVQLRDVTLKSAPITNPTGRAISFIHTTWDRFVRARVIADLYSEADVFVDRVFYALGERAVPAER